MMTRFVSIVAAACMVMAVSVFSLTGCGGDPPEPELLITNESFSITMATDRQYAVKATGTVRNVGDVDVVNLVIAGGCPSCSTTYRHGQWYLPERERTDDETGVIRYLGAGEQADFEVNRVAYFPTGGGEGPDELPDEMEVYIMSYDVSN